MPRLPPVTRRIMSRSVLLGIDRGGLLEPDLDLVAVEIGREEIRLAGHELALFLDGPAGFLHRSRGGGDVLRIAEPETEVRDAADLPCLLLVFFEDQHVACAGRLQLHEALL